MRATALCLLLFTSLCLQLGCSTKPAPTALGCSLNSDCMAPLVCNAGECKPECVEDRDCIAPQVCAEVTGGRLCQDVDAGQ